MNTSIRCRGASILGALLLPLFAFAGPVDVNSADAETLSAELNGVGLSRANAIVEYRKAHGPFRTLEDLEQVKGIGRRTIELNRDNILFEPRPVE